MKQLVIEKECLGFPICARVDIPADGLAVLLTGGCKPHVGAVSAAEPGGDVQTTQFAGHCEGVVSAQWARALRDRYDTRAAVVCGIHYDALSRAGIEEVLNCCNLLLQDILASIGKIRRKPCDH